MQSRGPGRGILGNSFSLVLGAILLEHKLYKTTLRRVYSRTVLFVSFAKIIFIMNKGNLIFSLFLKKLAITKLQKTFIQKHL